MHKMLPCMLLACSIITSLFTTKAFAQDEPDSLLKDAPHVFIDCQFCDESHIRQNITWLNYVRDRKVADVHILATRQNTGAGGREFTFQFIGLGAFEGKNDTLVFTTLPNESWDNVRTTHYKLIKIGMMPYMAHTPLASQMNIDYEIPVEPTQVEDKWNNWVFEVGGSGWFNGEESYQSFNSNMRFSADRITPKWKIELFGRANYNESRFDLGDEILVNIQRSQRLNTRVVGAINDHWSYGTYVNGRSSIFDNYKLHLASYPGIEYNLFPYHESTRHQLRLSANIGYEYRWYNDSTIYDKLEEGLFGTSFAMAFSVQEKWGSVSVSANANAFLDDLSRNELRIWSNLRLQLFKGFSFRIGGNVSLIRNQLNLVKGDASEEDILLRQRQIATNYRYWGDIGISYTFGSIYNTVVNPRFGG